ncbi:hypothetical protein [Alkalihalobacillus sp. LMS39]|uniref:hypothetical protein n=1 Tax=Alkalihalobacillus sp. LMS39 TaxID=2924032 RepID=UPI001FB295ED|nr:hypothetical protein [Alkalihalobacillus sp. LMS39]UOE95167.1 hypothetical protein MM271_05955 [Alkalihalobacillus sp. LMS39]
MKKAVVLILLIFTLVGCSNESKSDNQKVAEEYLSEKGYNITSYNGAGQSYQLTKEKLVEMPSVTHWTVQSVDPDLYLDKQVETEGFTVDNHPLTNADSTHVNVDVFLVEGKPIGGISYPQYSDEKELALGDKPFSLDGKTVEEVHQLENWREWMDAWYAKYE